MKQKKYFTDEFPAEGDFVDNESVDSVFKTKDTLLHYYLKNEWHKLASLDFLRDRILLNNYKNILSLGAGKCVLEYLLKVSLQPGHTVIASDFVAFYIDKAKEFFPEITSVRFDFYKDNIKDLKTKLGINLDVAVFFGSAMAMDDEQVIDILSGLKKSGVKEIIDFHQGKLNSI